MTALRRRNSFAAIRSKPVCNSLNWRLLSMLTAGSLCLAFSQPGLAVPAGQTSECSFLVLFYASLLKLDLFLQLASQWFGEKAESCVQKEQPPVLLFTSSFISLCLSTWSHLNNTVLRWLAPTPLVSCTIRQLGLATAASWPRGGKWMQCLVATLCGSGLVIRCSCSRWLFCASTFIGIPPNWSAFPGIFV